MPSPDQSPPRICLICKEDCSSRARVKDKAGNYYCQTCYERAKEERAARKQGAAQKASVAAATPPPPPALDPLPMDDGFDALAAAAAEAAAATPVEAPRPAAPVKAARRVVPQAAPVKRERSIGVPDALKQPWIAFVAPLLVLGVLFIPASGNEELASLFLVPQLLFGFAVGVLVLVQAFREGIVTGILTFIPIYALYFVFSVNQNAYLKGLYGAAILGYVASFWVGPGLADSMPASSGY